MSEELYLRIAPDVVLGQEVTFGPFVNLYGCRIGDECTIGAFVEIQAGVQVGRKVKIQSHTFICSGVVIEDEAFIGHGVMFVNDRYPRATTRDGKKQRSGDWNCQFIRIGRRSSIGSNATILGGVVVGEESMVGAGSLVVRDVPPQAVVAGNPAKVLRYLDNK